MKVDYGIRLVSFLASKPKGNLFKAQDISKEKHIPFSIICNDVEQMINYQMERINISKNNRSLNWFSTYRELDEKVSGD